MQNNSTAQKARIMADGEEVAGFISMGEVAEEDEAIQVPGFQIIRNIRTGVRKMPEVEFAFETRRNTNTRQFLADWYHKKETKNLTIIYCDADGVEFARYLWSDVECRKHTIPATDHSKVDYAQVSVILIPYDITEAS